MDNTKLSTYNNECTTSSNIINNSPSNNSSNNNLNCAKTNATSTITAIDNNYHHQFKNNISTTNQSINSNTNNSAALAGSNASSAAAVAASSEQCFTKIIDNLYLTSAKYITDEHLVNHNITHIVNATRTVPLKRNYRTCRINIVDSVFENIGAHFDSVSEFIEKALENDGCVVVHCISGISRSSTLVIAYLMKYKSMSLKEAFDFVRSKRWFIRPNTGFFEQLIDYELKLFGTNTVKMIYHESGGYVPDFILEDKSNYKYFYLCIKK